MHALKKPLWLWLAKCLSFAPATTYVAGANERRLYSQASDHCGIYKMGGGGWGAWLTFLFIVFRNNHDQPVWKAAIMRVMFELWGW